MNRYLQKRNRQAWIVLIITMSITILSWHVATTQNSQSAKVQFKLYVDDISDAIIGRLKDQQQILLGGAALFDIHPEVTRKEWHDYVSRLDLQKNYPGILGVGYSQIVYPQQLADFEAGMRAQGFSNFKIKPAGKRSIYSSIVYLEPFSGRNLAAFGYDMLSQQTRASAMTKAADTGTTIISGKVTLVQETHGKVQAGFLMYVPIYREGMSLTTSKQRWQAIKGYVYSPYRVDDLMHGILGNRNAEVNFSIYDGENLNADTLMYDSAESDQQAGPEHTPQFRTQEHINIFGHTWLIDYHSSRHFEQKFSSAVGWVILLLGSLTAILIFSLISFLQFRRDRAEEMAENMTLQLRQDKEKLRASEERFDLAVRASTEGIWDWDITTDSYYYSPRFMELLGLSDKITYAKTDLILQYLNEEEHFASCQSLKTSLQEKDKFNVTCRLRTVSGELRWFRNCGIAVRADDGELVRIVGSILDITESMQAERELRENHAQTRTILDNVIDGIFTINSNGIIQTANRACEKIYGYQAQEMIGISFHKLFPDYYRKQNTDILESIQDTYDFNTVSATRELESMRKDGSIIPIDIAISRISMKGKPLFIVMVRDITERKRIEQLKSEFVSTVSHELRTPLTSIKGAIALVLSKSASELSTKSEAMLDTALRNSERLALLIDDILDLEKIESGRLQFEFKPIDLIAQAQIAIESNESYAQQHAVTLSFYSEHEAAPVWGDNNRIQQVFSNLISNAVKFSPANSQVKVRLDKTGHNYRITVRDHGLGVPAEFGSRIFQRFAQADSSDTREKGGTGLGLSISKVIVERHDGNISYRNHPDGGTEFFFELHEYRSDYRPSSMQQDDNSASDDYQDALNQ